MLRPAASAATGMDLVPGFLSADCRIIRGSDLVERDAAAGGGRHEDGLAAELDLVDVAHVLLLVNHPRLG